MAFIEFLQTPIAHEIWMAQGGFLTPHTRREPRHLRRPTCADEGRDPAERHHLPLRRLRPDARRRRRRGLLDRHGRLCRRQAAADVATRSRKLGRAEVIAARNGGVHDRGRPRDPGSRGRGKSHTPGRCLLGGGDTMNPALQGLITIIVGVGGCVGISTFRTSFSTRFCSRPAGRTRGATSTAPTRSGPGCSCFRRCSRSASTSPIRCSRRCACR
jgi:hypothetical protein